MCLRPARAETRGPGRLPPAVRVPRRRVRVRTKRLTRWDTQQPARGRGSGVGRAMGVPPKTETSLMASDRAERALIVARAMQSLLPNRVGGVRIWPLWRFDEMLMAVGVALAPAFEFSYLPKAKDLRDDGDALEVSAGGLVRWPEGKKSLRKVAAELEGVPGVGEVEGVVVRVHSEDCRVAGLPGVRHYWINVIL